MLSNPRTSLAGGAGALLLGLFAFLGPEPISWPRAAVLIAACGAIAALGIFAPNHRPAQTPSLSVSTPPPAKVDDADPPAVSGPK